MVYEDARKEKVIEILEDCEMENCPSFEAITGMIEMTTEPRVKRLILEILRPELNQQVSSRSSIEMESFDRGLRILVRGTDLSSFRASFNSIMRLLNVVFGVLKTVGNTKDVK